jgi:hypothetical protein
MDKNQQSKLEKGIAQSFISEGIFLSMMTLSLNPPMAVHNHTENTAQLQSTVKQQLRIIVWHREVLSLV